MFFNKELQLPFNRQQVGGRAGLLGNNSNIVSIYRKTPEGNQCEDCFRGKYVSSSKAKQSVTVDFVTDS